VALSSSVKSIQSSSIKLLARKETMSSSESTDCSSGEGKIATVVVVAVAGVGANGGAVVEFLAMVRIEFGGVVDIGFLHGFTRTIRAVDCCCCCCCCCCGE